jgi:HEAT repeat protein
MVGVHALVALMLPAAPPQDPDPLPIIERLRAADPAARLKARTELRAVGARAVEPLCGILEDRRPELERRAQALMEKLEDEDAQVREEATVALLEIGPRVEAVIRGGAEKAQGEARWRLGRVMGWIKKNQDQEREASARQKEGACEVLGALGDARALEPLAKAVRHEDPAVRLAAIQALGSLADGRGAEPLARIVEGDADKRMRAAAARALGRIGTPEARQALRDRLGGAETDEQVVRRLLEGLAQDPSAEAARLIVRRLEAPSAVVREAAFRLAAPRAGLEKEPFDAARPADPATRRTVERFHAWWAGRFGKPWE